MYLAGLGSGYPFARMRLLLCRFVNTSLPRQVHDKGGGNQGAVPTAVFAALEAWAGVQALPKPLEAFASPLNTNSLSRGAFSTF